MSSLAFDAGYLQDGAIGLEGIPKPGKTQLIRSPAPHQLRAKCLSHSQIELNWIVVRRIETWSETEWEFDVEVNKLADFRDAEATESVAVTSDTDTVFEDADGCLKMYSYRVRARAGELPWSDWSPVVQEMMLPQPPFAPEPPEFIEHTWNTVTIKPCREPPVTRGAPVSSYFVYVDGERVKRLQPEGQHLVLGPAPSHTPFKVCISADSMAGVSEKSSTVLFSTGPPEAPTLPGLVAAGTGVQASHAVRDTVRVVGADYHSVSFEWDGASSRGLNVTGYDFWCTLPGSSDIISCGGTGHEDRTGTLHGLDQNTAYQVSVVAYAQEGTERLNGEAATVLAKTVAFGVPELLDAPVVLRKNYNSMELSWSAPGRLNGTPLTGFSLEMSSEAGETVSLITEEMLETLTVENLLADTEYNYQLTAHNAVGASQPVCLDAATELPEPPEPPAPVQLVATRWDSLHVAWSPVCEKDLHGAPALGYVLTVHKLAAGESYPIYIEGATTVSHEVDQLEASSDYGLSLTAFNRAGSSRPSEMATFRTDEPPVPGMMDRPWITEASSTALTLEWQAPECLGCALTGYSLRWRSLADSEPAWEDEVKHSLLTKVSLSQLIPAQEYEFGLRAHNRAGVGPEVFAVVAPPPAPPSVIRGIRFCGATWDTVSIEWDRPEEHGAATTGYELSYRLVGNAEYQSVELCAEPREYTIQRLLAESKVEVTIVAHSDSGDSNSGPSARFRSDRAPAPMLMCPPRVEDLSWDHTTIAWDLDEAISPGAPITGFSLKWKSESGIWRRELIHSMATSVSITTGLQPEIEHTVSVCAHNNSGTSPEVTVAFTPRALPPLAPSHPTLVSSQQDSIEVHWSPAVTRGTPVTGYTVCCTSSEHDWCVVHRTTDTSLLLKDLAPATSVLFTVAADSAAGLGDPSDSLMSETAASVAEFTTAPSLPPCTVGPAELVHASCETLTVRWSAPDIRGSVITGYSVACYTAEDGEMQAVHTDTVGAEQLEYTFYNLKEQTDYVILIQAISLAGSSDCSGAVAFQTLAEFPVPYAEIRAILLAMMTDILRGKVQDDGCLALAHIASQHPNWAIAVAQLGGLAACVRAKRAYPMSADIQTGSDSVLYELCKHPDGGLRVLQSYTGIHDALVEMALPPWNNNTQGTAGHILERLRNLRVHH
eukprot:TRINITY_DN9618_c0_g1_i1.p1 TRINITY_DN9618_c0_g1~~TRINITY_DN9618_c0_g1_i1.p1  ORF type:complete len:1167 (+),score=234.13 TRINITY_DN9618_c0_g1_i1:38-3538(+)